MTYTKRCRFQSTPSPRRETVFCFVCVHIAIISIHSLPKEGDLIMFEFALERVNFNPLPPQGGRLLLLLTLTAFRQISIHSLPKEGDGGKRVPCGIGAISIHSLPKEGDRIGFHKLRILKNFNPLPPQGGRQGVRLIIACKSQFQSTPSPRRETLDSFEVKRSKADFNPLPPQGGRLFDSDGATLTAYISIHSLPKEGDCYVSGG